MPNGVPPTQSMTTAEAAVQITRANYSWSTPLGQPAAVTYAFRDSIPDGYVSSAAHQEGASFQPLTLAMQLQVTLALQLWSEVAGINFLRVNDANSVLSNSATMLFGSYLSTTDASAAFAPFPGDSNHAARSGDVWLNRNSFTTVPDIGDRNFMVILHEIGHAIGLQHPGNYNAEPDVEITYVNDALYIQDTNQFTMMSYFEEFAGQPEAPLLHDIAAAQRLYGANLGTRLGNDVYGFGSSITGPTGVIYDFARNTAPNFAIWDAGGIDTLNTANFTQDQVINLNPDSFSSIGGQTNNIAMAAVVRNAQGIVVNWIENAVGGTGHDQIFGNAVNNLLQGRDGNDTLEGFAGYDTLDGGQGRDAASWWNAPGGVTVNLLTRQAFGAGSAGTDQLISIEDVLGSNFADNITGDNADNLLHGYGGNDVLNGRLGNDIIHGGEGNDLIVVTGGTNWLYGEAGNDTIRPGLDPDAIDGGPGLDTVDYSLATARVVVDRPFGGGIAGFAWGDTYTLIERFVGSAFDDIIKGNATAETLEGGDGNDWLEGGFGNDRLIGGRGIDTLLGGAGADTLDGGDDYDGAWFTGSFVAINLTTGVHGGAAAGDVFLRIESFLGTDGADSMMGNGDAHDFYGGAGNDTLDGGAGNDKLFGGLGDDVLYGGFGDDVLYGGGGNDEYWGGEGFDLVSFADREGPVFIDFASGPFGNVFNPLKLVSIEDIEGTRFGDEMWGRADEANHFRGGAGADTMGGRGGADVLDGEGDDDVIVVQGFELRANGDGGTAFGNFDELRVGGTAGVFNWATNSFAVDGKGILQVLGFEMARGGAGGDAFTANWQNLSFYGEAGNDTLTGGAGDNVLEGGDGADRLFFGGGFDYADYRSDTTGVLADIRAFVAAFGHAAGDTWLDAPEGLMGGSGNDSLGGSDGANRLLGRDGNDYVSAYGGDDTLDGGAGEDSLEGGLGADIVAGGDGADRLSDGLGILLPAGEEDDAEDTLQGGAGNDTLIAAGGADLLEGGADDDLLTGGAGADLLNGGAGHDVLADHTQLPNASGALLAGHYAATDADTLLGGDGHDMFLVSGGGDLVDGGADIDSLLMDFTGASGALVFTMRANGASFDMTLGGAVTATVRNVETLHVTAGNGRDVMNATAASFYVVLDGGPGNDVVRGGASGDVLMGWTGNDRLVGNGGDDLLVGGLGADTLEGGAGADLFRWDVAAEGRDRILGFVSGEDRLWVDASGFKGGLREEMDLAATGRFVAGSAATAARGQFLYDQATGTLLWDVDGTGARGAVQMAELGAGTALAASDFLIVA